MPLYWYIPFLVAVIAFALDTICIFQRACRRRSLRLASALVLLYFIALFAMIIWGDGVTIPLLRTGFFTAIGITILLALHIADVISGRG